MKCRIWSGGNGRDNQDQGHMKGGWKYVGVMDGYGK